MGWFSSLNKDRHRCATLIQSGRYFKSYRKWLVQWVFADQLDVPTYGDAAVQGCRLSVLRDWWYNLPGPPFFFPPLLTSSPCLLSRGVFVLGFQILTRHRSVPWKSSWHTVRTVVPLPETQTKEDKLENRLCGTPRAFSCVTIEFLQHVFGVIALLLHVSGFASPLLWRDIILYISGFYIISSSQKHKKYFGVLINLYIKKKINTNILLLSPCRGGQPGLLFCRPSWPALGWPGRPCPQSSSASPLPTALCAWWTAERGCYAPSPQSSPESGSQTGGNRKGAH